MQLIAASFDSEESIHFALDMVPTFARLLMLMLREWDRASALVSVSVQAETEHLHNRLLFPQINIFSSIFDPLE